VAGLFISEKQRKVGSSSAKRCRPSLSSPVGFGFRLDRHRNNRPPEKVGGSRRISNSSSQSVSPWCILDESIPPYAINSRCRNYRPISVFTDIVRFYRPGYHDPGYTLLSRTLSPSAGIYWTIHHRCVWCGYRYIPGRTPALPT